MKSKAIIASGAAQEDVIGAARYIAEDSVDAAYALLEAVDQTYQLIARQPGIGSIYPTNQVRLRGLLRMPVAGFANYLVFYQVGESAILIIRVLHGARDIPSILDNDAD